MKGKKFINSRGQFFSPDLVIALGVFIFALIVFFTTSTSIFNQSALYDERKNADEVSHMVLNSFVLSGGDPTNWENTPILQSKSIGLVSSNNVIVPGKILVLVNDLNNEADYSLVKEKLGLGPYNLHLRLLNSRGEVISYAGNLLDGGFNSSDSKFSLTFKRFVVFEGEPAVLEGEFSLEK